MHTSDIIDLEKLENKHWWHIAKREIIKSCADRFGNRGNVLEIGAGSGSLLNSLKSFGETTAVDMNAAAIAACRAKGIVDLHETSFENFQSKKKFTVVVAADIIEHIKNDRAAIDKIYSITESGGVCIIHVPAFQFLYSYWDKKMGHYRRYSVKDLEEVITDAGFKIELSTYRLMIFMPLVWLFRKFKKDSETSDFNEISSLNRVFLAVARMENYLIKIGVKLPFGLSILIVARK